MAKPKAAITLAESINIPLNQLKLSEDNVRKIYAKADIADMAADIRTNGLLQSLSVRSLAEPDGDARYEVQGGGRRFRALQLLVKQKSLAADTPIPCVPNDNEIAAQLSLAENTQRLQLHPLDEFRAFAEMLAKGKSEDDIAAAFRISTHVVKQRLRLGSASPVLHKAFADGKLNLKDLMAFCVTDNHERQEQVWTQVQDQTYLNTSAIKQMLTESSVAADDKRARFIGVDAYEAAGGIVERDLFDDGHEGYLADVNLLDRLVQAKLDQEAGKLKAKGWQWAMTGVTIPYSDTSAFDQLAASNAELTEDEERRLEALEAEREELEEIEPEMRSKKQRKRLGAVTAAIDAIDKRELLFSAEDMARAGVTLEIASDGTLLVEYGYLKPEDKGSAMEQRAGDDGAGATPGPAIEADDGGIKLPDGLITDLTIHRTLALQAALARNADVAFLAVLHAIALTVLYPHASTSCVEVIGRAQRPLLDDLKTFAPMKAMDDNRKVWTARLPRESGELWHALEAMSRGEQMQLLAFVAASSVNAIVTKHETYADKIGHSHILADALGYDIGADWSPTADNFFKRVTKSVILGAVAEARDERSAARMSHMKKEGMCREAERLIAGTGWLPEPLRRPEPETGRAATVADDEDDVMPSVFAGDDGAGEGVPA